MGYHLTAYNGRDDKLFRGAIMQSGNPINFGALNDALGYADMYNELTRRTNCANQTSPLECLRALPVEQLNTAINTTSTTLNVTEFMPVLDGDFIQKRTSLQLAAGDFVHVPILDGANSDEGTPFSPSPVNSTADFEMFVTAAADGRMTANFTQAILSAYPDNLSVNVVASLGDQRPGPPFGAKFCRSASYFGDVAFIAPRRKTCETWAAANLTAYCYRFNAIPAGLSSHRRDPLSGGFLCFQQYHGCRLSSRCCSTLHQQDAELPRLGTLHEQQLGQLRVRLGSECLERDVCLERS